MPRIGGPEMLSRALLAIRTTNADTNVRIPQTVPLMHAPIAVAGKGTFYFSMLVIPSECGGYIVMGTALMSPMTGDCLLRVGDVRNEATPHRELIVRQAETHNLQRHEFAHIHCATTATVLIRLATLCHGQTMRYLAPYRPNVPFLK